MLMTLVWENLKRQRGKKVLAVLSVVTGIGIETALLNVTFQINDRLAREMRSYGANLLVLPAGATAPLVVGGSRVATLGDARTLDESALDGLGKIFWRNNLLGAAPFLYAEARAEGKDRVFTLVGTRFGGAAARGAAGPEGRGVPTSVRVVCPWWRVEGEWPGADEADALLVGADLARELAVRAGDRLAVRLAYGGGSSAGGGGGAGAGTGTGTGGGAPGAGTVTLVVRGVVHAGGFEDGQAFAQLGLVQRLTGQAGGMAKALVSALTAPEEHAPKDTGAMTSAELEKWSCSPYPSTIARQLQEMMPGARVEPIARITRSEGSFLNKVHLLLALVTILALVAAALGVATTMNSVILGRRREIALMRTLGGTTQHVLLQFLAESVVLGLVGGALGYGAGVLLAQGISVRVFGIPGELAPAVFPLMLVLSVIIVFAGMLAPILRTLALAPMAVLKDW
ncbi:MAG: ABC transporter permease [Planctomycetes bacterium]|nr:ABC transporter permease [Planctomycetota bacterium]